MAQQSAFYRVVRFAFIGLLSINALAEIAIGAVALFAPTLALDFGFGIAATPELLPLPLALGSNLLFLGVALGLAALWTAQRKREGVVLGMAGSCVFVAFGAMTFVMLGSTEGLMMDGIRGLLTIVLGGIVLAGHSDNSA